MNLVEVTCTRCGVVFGLATDVYAQLRRSEQTFHCTFGHKLSYTLGESEADKLRRERDRLRQRQAQLEDSLEHERRSARAYRGQATRLRNRAKAGVCPCCNRSFASLARHMASQHPDFGGDA